MTISPTSRQADALRFITGYQIAHGGISPSLADVRRALGLASKSTICQLLDALEERGIIRRLPGLARAIDVLHPLPVPRAPDGAPLYAVRIGDGT